MKRTCSLAAAVLTLAARAAAQPPLFTDSLPPAEFAARRARVIQAIGDGAAVIQGATELPSYHKFRQNNQFFYLTGVEVPRAILVIDGRAKTSTLFLLPRDERAERSEGPVLAPGPDAEKLTGIEHVAARTDFAAAVEKFGAEGRTLFMPHRPEALGAATPGYTEGHARKSLADPWDGRKSRELTFIERVKEKAPGATLRAIATRARFTEQELKDVLGQVLAILDHLHSLRPPVIHRHRLVTAKTLSRAPTSTPMPTCLSARATVGWNTRPAARPPSARCTAQSAHRYPSPGRTRTTASSARVDPSPRSALP